MPRDLVFRLRLSIKESQSASVARAALFAFFQVSIAPLRLLIGLAFGKEFQFFIRPKRWRGSRKRR